jgi:hypothetical protein
MTAYYDGINTVYDLDYISKRASLAPYYHQGVLARLMGFPKTDNPYGKYKENRFALLTTKQRFDEYNRGWDDQDHVLSDYHA